MQARMAKVQVAGLRSDFERVLAELHAIGVLELTPMQVPQPLETPSLKVGPPNPADVAAVEAAIGSTGELLAALPAVTTPTALAQPVATLSELLAQSTALANRLKPDVDRLLSRRAALEIEQSNLRHYATILERLLPLGERLTELEGFETMALIIQPDYAFVLDSLRDELSSITHQQCEVMAATAQDGSVAMLLVFSRRFAAEVHDLLQGQQLTEVRLPAEYYGRSFEENLADVRHREQDIPSELEHVAAELERILGPNATELATCHEALLDRLDELMAESSCVQTDFAFVLGGWLPERNLGRLEQRLSQAFDGRIALERLPLGREEASSMPVLLENAPLLRPFQVLLQLQPTPRYGTIDPTPFVAIFFPLFFGLMLGDIGYGAVLLGASLWVQRRKLGPVWVQQGARVMTLAALMAIGFGLAFGEFFGNLGQMFGLHPLLLNRSAAIQPLLLFSLAVGLAQVGLGLVLGIINGVLERQKKEIVSRGATLLGLVAILSLVAMAADFLPRGLLTPGVTLLAVAIALLVYSVGLVGPIELFGVIGNVISYTRLVAVGLASVILAQVANQFAGRMGNIVVGIIVAALFHALNLALGLFSPSIQSLRLQYVEFFGRFFEGGGRPFTPFRSRATARTEGTL
jgi:V/A-type H+/Na+-transporting ATPase subunit I